MSAFLCDDKIFNNIASTLTFYAEQEPINFYSTAQAAAFILDKQVVNDDGSIVLYPPSFAQAAIFAKELYNMNLAAVSQRYEDGINDDYGYKFKVCPPMSNMIALFKNINCLMYQCCEGDVPESDLYKKMEKIQDALAYDIVTNTKEYKIANWG